MMKISQWQGIVDTDNKIVALNSRIVTLNNAIVEPCSRIVALDTTLLPMTLGNHRRVVHYNV